MNRASFWTESEVYGLVNAMLLLLLSLQVAADQVDEKAWEHFGDSAQLRFLP